ncbi:hypothetical protein SFRURICE_003333, partial [Spodoptera frugiperda]
RILEVRLLQKKLWGLFCSVKFLINLFFVGKSSVVLFHLGGGTHIFPLWKRLTFKRLILTKSGFRNL